MLKGICCCSYSFAFNCSWVKERNVCDITPPPINMCHGVWRMVEGFEYHNHNAISSIFISTFFFWFRMRLLYIFVLPMRHGCCVFLRFYISLCLVHFLHMLFRQSLSFRGPNCFLLLCELYRVSTPLFCWGNCGGYWIVVTRHPPPKKPQKKGFFGGGETPFPFLNGAPCYGLDCWKSIWWTEISFVFLVSFFLWRMNLDQFLLVNGIHFDLESLVIQNLWRLHFKFQLDILFMVLTFLPSNCYIIDSVQSGQEQDGIYEKS